MTDPSTSAPEDQTLPPLGSSTPGSPPPTQAHLESSQGSAPPPTRVGEYEILEEIARGGMGVVFRARQITLSRLVALKMILRGDLATAADRQRFKAEAEAAAHLDHPHIVPILEVGEHEGRPFFSMKLFEGGCLGDLLPALKTDHRRAAELVAQIARAVHHGHQRGLLHRDLKPANILLDQEGQPHVTDFGLARRMQGPDGPTRSGDIVGTPGYMAPEQASGKKGLTTGVDIYSLGVMLFEMATGQLPFREPDPVATLLKVVSAEPPRPRSVNPAVDQDLETICLKCLEKDPDRRYATAAELADELDRWRRGEAIAARQPGFWERAGRWRRRHPAQAAFWGLLGASLLVVTFLSLRFAGQQRHAADEVRKSLDQSRRLVAELALDRGLGLCKDGDLGRGLLWLARCLEMTEGVLPDLERTARLNLSSWSGQVHSLQSMRSMQIQVHNRQEQHVDLAFNPPGTTLLLKRQDGTVVGFDPNSIDPERFKIDQATGAGWRFSPHRKYFFNQAAWDESMPGTWKSPADRYFAADSGAIRKLVSPDGAAVLAAAFSPDDRVLLIGTAAKNAWLLDAERGLPMAGPLPHGGPVDLAAFSPDGAIFLTGCRENTHRLDEGVESIHNGQAFAPKLRLWRSTDGAALSPSLVAPYGRQSPLFSPDSRWLLVRGPQGARLWRTATGQPHGAWQPWHGNMMFSPDSAWIMWPMVKDTGEADAKHTRWNVWTGQRETLEHAQPLSKLAFSTAAPRYSLLLHHKQEIRDTSTGAVVAAVDRPEYPWPILSPSGQRWLTFGSEGRLLDLLDGKPLARIRHQGDLGRNQPFDPSGRFLATLLNERTVAVWSATTGELLGDPLPHPYPVQAWAWCPKGKLLATWCDQRAPQPEPGAPNAGDPIVGELRVVAVAQGPPEGHLSMHLLPVTMAAFSPDGRTLATGSGDRSVRLWNAQDGRNLGQPLPQSTPVHGLTFSPDGGQMVVSGGRVGLVTSWLPHLGRKHSYDFSNPEGTAWELEGPPAFTPDNGLVLTSTKIEGFSVWNAHGGRLANDKDFFPLFAGRFEKPWGQRMMVCPDGQILGQIRKPHKRQDGIEWVAEEGYHLWNPAEQRRGPKLAIPGKPVLVTKDNQVLTLDRGQGHLWQLPHGNKIGPPLGARKDGLDPTMAWSRDGRWLVVRQDSGSMELWDTRRQSATPLNCQGLPLALNDAGDRLALLMGPVQNPTEVRVVTLPEGKPVSPALPGGVHTRNALFSPNGARFLYQGDRTISLLDTETWKPVREGFHHGDCTFGSNVVMAANPDGSLQALHWKTREPVGEPLQQSSAILAHFLTWDVDADHGLAITVDADRTARFWDPKTGKAVGPKLPLPPFMDQKAFLAKDPNQDRRFFQITSDAPLGIRAMTKAQIADQDQSWKFAVFPAPVPMAGSAADIMTRIQAATGRRLDPRGVAVNLDVDGWRKLLPMDRRPDPEK